MFSFYACSRTFRVFIGILGGMTVISQAIYIVFSSRRFDWQNYRGRLLFEYILLINVIVLSAIPPMLNYLIRDGFLPFTILKEERVIVYILLLLFTILRIRGTKQYMTFLNIAILTPMLPMFDNFAIPLFPFYLTGVLFYFFFRGIYLSYRNLMAIRRGISVWSIKEAMDSLHSGILFCEKGGTVLLMNNRMKQLMVETTGRIFRDGIKFFNEIQKRLSKEDSILYDEGKVVLSLSDKKHWHFWEDELSVGNREFLQITATDITEQWQLLCELEEQNRLLENKSKQLSDMLDNMFQIQRQREKIRLRGRLHDLLSQRITIFQRWMQSDTMPSAQQVSDLLQTLKEGLVQDVEKDTKSGLENLIRQFQEIGVTLKAEGEPPENLKYANVFLLCIREAATNAVRHSLASEVDLFFEESEEEYMLRIKNNGIVVQDEIVFGNGLKTMQGRLAQYGGRLIVESKPQFLLTAIIPKEENHV